MSVRRIEAVDFFYLSMPEVTTEGDGSQDALLVRVTAGGLVGWGECEASFGKEKSRHEDGFFPGKFGGRQEDRTPGLRVANAALSQLS